MKRTWLVAAAMTAGLGVQAQRCRPGVQTLTEYSLSGGTLVPNHVLARAKATASKVLAGAAVRVVWVKGERPGDARVTFCGDRLTITFDDKAPARFTPRSFAHASLNAGRSTEIHIFYDRVSAFPDRLRTAGFLGQVLAHEVAHVLQGVARHSSEGSGRPGGTIATAPSGHASRSLFHLRMRN